MSKKDEALALVSLGFAVLPCWPGRKNPRILGGVTNASSKPRQVARWFDLWPDALIGVATGPRSGVLVVDVDDLDAIDVERLTPARIHKTPRGFHAWYRFPAGSWITIGQNSLGDGIDHRGAGGYAIYWPAEGLAADGPALDDLPAPPSWIVTALD